MRLPPFSDRTFWSNIVVILILAIYKLTVHFMNL